MLGTSCLLQPILFVLKFKIKKAHTYAQLLDISRSRVFVFGRTHLNNNALFRWNKKHSNLNMKHFQQVQRIQLKLVRHRISLLTQLTIRFDPIQFNSLLLLDHLPIAIINKTRWITIFTSINYIITTIVYKLCNRYHFGGIGTVFSLHWISLIEDGLSTFINIDDHRIVVILVIGD